MVFDELLVPCAALDELLGDAVGDGEVGLRAEFQIVIGEFRGARAAGAEVDDGDFLAALPAVEDARKQHRVHLRHVVSPHEQHVAGVEIVVTAGGLVHAVGRDVAGDGGGHAKAGVGLDVVVGQAALHELGGGVAFGNRRLAGGVETETRRVFHDALGDDVDGLLPGNFLQHAIAAEHRIGEAVLAVEDAADVVALHAEQALVHRGIRVAGDGDDFPILHADLHVAAGAAEPAGSLVPLDAIRRWRWELGRLGACGGSGTGSCESGGFEESAAFDQIHGAVSVGEGSSKPT